MIRLFRLFTAAILFMAAAPLFAQTAEDKTDIVVLGGEIAPKDGTKQNRFKNHLIAPKGEWQCGLAVMYADFLSDNLDYMLAVQ